MLLLPRRAVASSFQASAFRRGVSTLSTNPHIYVHPQPDKTFLLSFLESSPPNPALAIGSTKELPPSPDSLTENPNFLRIVHSVIRQHGPQDPEVQAQAQTFASNAGASLGSGGVHFPSNHPSQAHKRTKRRQHSGDGAGGASSQGGMGGAGRGGWIHVSDQRNPPDFGRVAWPEDIFGSLEVDGEGKIVDDGRYQESGTYRMVTREGILGLSPFLRGKVVARLKELEKQ